MLIEFLFIFHLGFIERNVNISSFIIECTIHGLTYLNYASVENLHVSCFRTWHMFPIMPRTCINSDRGIYLGCDFLSRSLNKIVIFNIFTINAVSAFKKYWICMYSKENSISELVHLWHFSLSRIIVGLPATSLVKLKHKNHACMYFFLLVLQKNKYFMELILKHKYFM
jgi:hypothetical protein